MITISWQLSFETLLQEFIITLGLDPASIKGNFWSAVHIGAMTNGETDFCLDYCH